VRRIVAVDGGGLLGVIPAGFLAFLEEKLLTATDRFSRIFDLVIGTSTGAILGAFLASGKRASQAAELYRTRGKAMFGTAEFRNWVIERPWMGKYSRPAFVKELSRWIDPTLRMSQLGTVYIATGDSLTDGRTHFFKSDDNRKTGTGPSDSNLLVMDVIARSGLSAPLYFCPVDDPVGQQVWIDGGTGTQNCPLERAVRECKRRGWHLDPEGCHILSLGTGWSDTTRSYSSASKRESWSTILDFATRARNQCETDQIERWEDFDKDLLPAVKVLRVNVRIPKEINVLDGAGFLPQYEEAAKRMIETWGLSAEKFLGLEKK